MPDSTINSLKREIADLRIEREAAESSYIRGILTDRMETLQLRINDIRNRRDANP